MQHINNPLKRWRRLWPALLITLCLTTLTLPEAWAQTPSAAQTNNNPAPSAQSDEASSPAANGPIDVNERLTVLAGQLEQRRAELAEIRTQIANLPKGTESPELKAREHQTVVSVSKLREAFEQLATNGIDLTTTSDERAKPYNWQDELVAVIKPVLGGLKELTEKPRRIEEMRNRIVTLQGQMAVADNALHALKRFGPNELDAKARENIVALRKSWLDRKNDILSDLEKTRVQLKALDAKGYSYSDAIVKPLKEFVVGRGLTLVISVAVGLAIWITLARVFEPLLKRAGAQVDRKARRSRERVISYLYRAFTIFAVIVGILVVFYLRSDTLLLAIAILIIAFSAIGLRHLAPKYVRELRLLVDMGSVREGERLIYNGLPMQVRTINTFAILRNPALEGIVRLPLSSLTEMVSRPVGDEVWFPSAVDDVVLLPDGSLGTVVRQTIDVVRIKIGPAFIDHPAADFAKLPLRNLSRDGYTHITTFGIDYQHQPIALEIVDEMVGAIETKLRASSYADRVENVSGEFKEAAANSLDYIFFVRMSGDAALGNFSIGRLVQQALVDLCNQRGWVIPFAQLTVHAGDGLEGLSS